MKRAIIIGGTGATGKQLVKQLLNNDKWKKITSIGRTSVLDGKKHEKLNDIVIDSLFDLAQTKEYWIGHDIFFNCLGTTRKRAGSAKEFIAIEAGISMEAAKIASSAKIPHVSLISANGANHKQWAHNYIHPLLYLRTMGQKEQSIIINKFHKVSIFRPGMLIRLIDKNSRMESIMSKAKFGLRVDNLATAMINDAISDNIIPNNSLECYYYNSDIKKLYSS